MFYQPLQPFKNLTKLNKVGFWFSGFYYPWMEWIN